VGKFFGQLPKGWPYAVEMRNKHWLHPDYFECLARHEVTHVFQFMGCQATGWRTNGAGQLRAAKNPTSVSVNIRLKSSIQNAAR
jgi:hypothetical protein